MSKPRPRTPTRRQILAAAKRLRRNASITYGLPTYVSDAERNRDMIIVANYVLEDKEKVKS